MAVWSSWGGAIMCFHRTSRRQHQPRRQRNSRSSSTHRYSLRIFLLQLAMPSGSLGNRDCSLGNRDCSLHWLLLSSAFVPLRFANVTLSLPGDPRSLDIAWSVSIAGLFVGTLTLGPCNHGATHCHTRHQSSSFSYANGSRSRGTLLRTTTDLSYPLTLH
jgi:hypothetical protein